MHLNDDNNCFDNPGRPDGKCNEMMARVVRRVLRRGRASNAMERRILREAAVARSTGRHEMVAEVTRRLQADLAETAARRRAARLTTAIAGGIETKL